MEGEELWRLVQSRSTLCKAETSSPCIDESASCKGTDEKSYAAHQEPNSIEILFALGWSAVMASTSLVVRELFSAS